MKWTIKLVFEAVPGSPVGHDVGMIERAGEISPANVGLTIAEGKAQLASLQEQIVTAQVQQQFLPMAMPVCGPFSSKLRHMPTMYWIGSISR